MPSRSHYDVLQLESRSATPDEIKRAFRRLSMEHHPDKNGNSDESKRAFQEINEAYDVLSDPAKRNNYDFEQQMGIGGHGIGGHGIGGHGIRMHHMGPMMGQMHSMGPMMGHMGPMMGHMGPMMGANPIEMLFAAMHNAHQAPHQAHMSNGFMESMFGTGMGPKIIIHNFTNTNTMHSNGDDAAPSEADQAYDTNVVMSISLTEAYAGCNQRPVTICYDDEAFMKQTETVFINLPSGIANGHTIRIPGKGNVASGGGRRGALTIEINVAEHPVFRREGDSDLVIDHRVSLKEALCGFTFELVHLNGRNYKFNCKPGSVTSVNETKVMPGLGFNDGGALKIRFSVDLPTSLTQEQIDALHNIL
jgi:molecular chaperone DnaJ